MPRSHASRPPEQHPAAATSVPALGSARSRASRGGRRSGVVRLTVVDGGSCAFARHRHATSARRGDVGRPDLRARRRRDRKAGAAGARGGVSIPQPVAGAGTAETTNRERRRPREAPILAPSPWQSPIWPAPRLAPARCVVAGARCRCALDQRRAHRLTPATGSSSRRHRADCRRARHGHSVVSVSPVARRTSHLARSTAGSEKSYCSIRS
jgi:hypothetical protein